MAVLTIQQPSLAGIALSFTAAAGGGDTIPVGSSNQPIFIYVKNGHTASQSVLIDDPNSSQPAGATAWNPDVTNPVPNAGERTMKLDNPSRFVDANGNINLTYTGVTALTVAVFK